MSSGISWTCYFSDPWPPESGEPRTELGGKGASLKEMMRSGLRVPPGFTLRTACCAEYFRRGRQWPEGLEVEVRHQLARLEEEMGRRYGEGSKPLLVSVRSGAAVSMPGMMDTLLNCGLHPGLAEALGDPPWFWTLYEQFITRFARTVHGVEEDQLGAPGTTREHCFQRLRRFEEITGQPFPTEPWAVLRASINAVFESWHSPRAEVYRERHGIRGLVGTAVNVQAMFPSAISGVLFTRDPTGVAVEQMVLEASYGLGESVVSGEVTPHRFRIERASLATVQYEPGHQVSEVSPFAAERPPVVTDTILSPPQVRELAELALRVEQHVGKPVDIEWGWAEGQFALLQSRPIRGLEVLLEAECARQEEITRLRQIAGGQRRVWIGHNLGETLATPTPLTWDFLRHFMSGAGGFGRLYQQLGYRPAQRVCAEGFLELIGGRIYADPERQAELFWEGMPLAYDLDALIQDRNLLNQAPGKFEAARADGLFLFRLPLNLWRMWRVSRTMKRSRATAHQRFEQEALPPFLDYVQREQERDLATLTDANLLALLESRRQQVLDDFGPESLRPGFFGGLALGSLEAMLAQLLGPIEGPQLARTLTSALEGDITCEQDTLLQEVAQGKTALARFLERFGHRAIGEMELSLPRWREDPSAVEKLAARLGGAGPGPVELHERTLHRRQEAEAQLPALLERWGGSCFREDLDRDLADARLLLPYRETGKHYLMMGYELLRQVLEELGQRWDLREELYFLTREELPSLPGARATLRPLIEQRRLRWQAWQKLYLAEVIESTHLDDLGRAPALSGATDVTGTALAPGVATGPARIVLQPQLGEDLGTGYVLVCTSTDPGWTPLFMHASALIVERGGVLSHGAIVARDFGIPAVACPDATRLIRAGETIRVDGNRGCVSLLAREEQRA